MVTHLLNLNPLSTGAERAVEAHSHPFWQLEVITGGSCTLQVDCELALEAGDLVLIPPEIRHSLYYPASGCEWLSFKFDMELTGETVLRLRATPELQAGVSFLRAVCATNPSLPERQRAIAGALGAVVELLLAQAARPAEVHSLKQTILNHLLSHNGDCNVRELARLLNLSPNYLSNLFHQTTGEGLKEFLDRERARIAVRLLRYDNLSVTEAAAEMGFADIYSFSRFFLRVTGARPSSCRR